MDGHLNLDAAFSALADPTRRAILARLAKGEATVMALAEPFKMTQPAISQHLKVLEDAGLVVRRVQGTPSVLVAWQRAVSKRWINGLAMLRKALERNYDRLDEVLADMEAQKKEKKSNEQIDTEDRRRHTRGRDKALRCAARKPCTVRTQTRS